MKSVFKYASALLLGAAGMYIGIKSNYVIVSPREYSELKLAKLELDDSEIFDDEWVHSDLCRMQRNRLSDVIRAAADNGCKHVIEAARGFGYNWDEIGYWGLPDWHHDITISVDSLRNWIFCY